MEKTENKKQGKTFEDLISLTDGRNLALIIGSLILLFALVGQFLGVNAGGSFPIILIALPVIYLVPSFIAGARKHRSGMAIVALNILLGWTFLGWVGALIWSLTGNVEEKKR